LEQVYRTFFDAFWQKTYGELRLAHLAGIERSSGQRRIVRWLHRLLAQAKQDGSPIAAGSAPANTRAGIEHKGYAQSMRLIEWKGVLMPEEQAYREGYQGGFERFKKSDDPDDDLESAVKRLQAEGKLPIYPETEVRNG
jgi:hypothetical protein